MRSKKTYPYPSRKNPIRLSLIAQEAREQLRELAELNNPLGQGFALPSPPLYSYILVSRKRGRKKGWLRDIFTYKISKGSK